MYRYFIRPVPGISVAEQTEMATSHGMKANSPLYQEKKDSFPKQRNALFDSIREGANDKIWVSDLGVIVQSRPELKQLRALMKKSGAAVWEDRTGRLSSKGQQFADMMVDWTDYVARKRHPNMKYVENGRRGGVAAAKKREEMRVPIYIAKAIWRDVNLTTQDAIDKINSIPGYKIDVSRSWAYRALGNRETPTGPRGSWKQ